VIDHLFLTMTTQVVEPDAFGHGCPFKVKERVCTLDLLPIAIPVLKAAPDQFRIVSSNNNVLHNNK
jgi:hypothetical protein